MVRSGQFKKFKTFEVGNQSNQLDASNMAQLLKSKSEDSCSSPSDDVLSSSNNGESSEEESETSDAQSS